MDLEGATLDEAVLVRFRVAYDAAFGGLVRMPRADILKLGHVMILTLIAENPGITQVKFGRVARRDMASVTKACVRMRTTG